MKSILRFLQIRRREKRRNRNRFVDPDEIFLDSKNLPDFDEQQFEGQLEFPIGRGPFWGIGIFLFILVVVFVSRLWFLQLQKGDTYLKKSQNNSLSREPIFAARGNIYDRNQVPLVWNEQKTDEIPWGKRGYIHLNGFSHILGYVKYPAKDSSGNYWQTEILGKDGIERYYDDVLRGVNGSTIVERDIAGKKQDGAVVDEPQNGKNLTLTIDSRLQSAMHSILVDYMGSGNFRSASAVMMNVNNGEMIILTNAPEYNSNILSDGKDSKTISGYFTNTRLPLLNRAVSGLFTPGSTLKPYVAMGALTEGVISPDKKILSQGYITVPNPYNPSSPGIFRDYNPNNGWVDLRKALAVSSNIYFFEVGGGYQSQKGIGIYNIGKYFSMFGLTSKTGIDLRGEVSGSVPSPEWKAEKFNGEAWRIGDTYNTAIGQYGVIVTPLELVRAVSAIANKGTLVTPHLVQSEDELPTTKIDLREEHFTIVGEGMRMGAQIGTASVLKSQPFSIATKSGTAQVGPGGIYVNSWMSGFFPYENPQYAFAVVLERGAQSGLGASQGVMHRFFDWLVLNAPEYTRSSQAKE